MEKLNRKVTKINTRDKEDGNSNHLGKSLF